MNYALSKQMEHLNILQMENQNPSENIISCTILSIDNATQTDDSHIVHDPPHSTVHDCTVTQSSSPPPTPQEQQIDNIMKYENVSGIVLFVYKLIILFLNWTKFLVICVLVFFKWGHACVI